MDDTLDILNKIIKYRKENKWKIPKDEDDDDESTAGRLKSEGSLGVLTAYKLFSLIGKPMPPLKVSIKPKQIRLTAEQKEMLDIYDQLSDEQKEAILTLMQTML